REVSERVRGETAALLRECGVDSPERIDELRVLAWTADWQLRELREDVKEIKGNAALLPGMDRKIDELPEQVAAQVAARLAELLDSKKAQVTAAPSGSTEVAAAPEFTEEERAIARRAIHAADAVTRGQALVVEGKSEEARQALGEAGEAVERGMEEAFRYY